MLCKQGFYINDNSHLLLSAEKLKTVRKTIQPWGDKARSDMI